MFLLVPSISIGKIAKSVKCVKQILYVGVNLGMCVVEIARDLCSVSWGMLQ
jgi:hypothetical protein